MREKTGNNSANNATINEKMKNESEESKAKLERLKHAFARERGLNKVPRNSDFLAAIGVAPSERKQFRTRPVRSISGVSVIAVMTKPAPCPGTCVYCVDSTLAPKSYTGFEPAALRARDNNFDSFKQVQTRLRQLREIGHEPSKCELVVMGGTFNSLPRDYQEDFLKKAFDAFNETNSSSLAQALKKNEEARHRVIGVTFETRPDWCSREHVERMLSYGATRVELGVQCLDDAVYEKMRRGHSVETVAKATRECKNAFLKVGYHYMPGLIQSEERDVKVFKKMFSDERFRPDMLKIYPVLVMPGTKLYEQWQQGEFQPYDEKQAVRVIARMKKIVPRYCRIMRVERDIPSNLIAAGVKKSNLRELAQAEMRKHGWKCSCIRCREAGLKQLKEGIEIDFNNLKLNTLRYQASDGIEVFLSFDDEKTNALAAFLRLRVNTNDENNSVGVRELRVFGEQVAVGEEASGKAVQHKSLGRKLLSKAEELAKNQFDARKLFVLSGVGVKPYYRKLGYRDDGFYVSKKL